MNQHQTAFNNFSSIVNAYPQEINRDDTIDATEKINNGIDEDEGFEYEDS